MVVIQGWYCKPKRTEKNPLYQFMETFLTDEFVRTHRRFAVSELVITGETKFVGNLLNMQEVYQVVNLKDEFNHFYVTKVVKDGLAKLIEHVPRNVIA